MPKQSKIQVFISYAREDGNLASILYSDLEKAGLRPWLDTKDLLPGQDWMDEVEKAIKRSRYFIALLSKNSVSKNGVVQKELKRALDRLDEYPPSTVYLVPVRIEECEPSYSQLRRLHWLDLFPSYAHGLSTLLRVLQRDVQELKDEAPENIHRNKSERLAGNKLKSGPIRRLQLDVSPEQLAELEALQNKVGLESKAELLNNAFTLLKWVSNEVAAGRAVGSIDEFDDSYKVLEMPIFRALINKAGRRGPA